MTQSDNSNIDSLLLRALNRLKSDRRISGFYQIPFELEFSLADSKGWLGPIQAQLKDGTSYIPAMACPLNTPKPKWHIRPASLLSINDLLVYHYLALSCLPNVKQHLEWSEGTIRFSHRLLDEDKNQWFPGAFSGWDMFRNRSIEILDSGYQFVLMTDIAGYYENIDIQRLIRELRALGIDNTTLENLSRCLNKWSEPRGRGIPQGFSPSDMFAELYLDTLDRHLRSEEFIHLRYMDDIRIFTNNETNARKALHTLTIHLRERGLNLQTAKTEIFPASQAKRRINKIPQIIENVSEGLAEELRQIEGIDDPYWPSVEEQIEELKKTNPDSPSIEVIHQAWLNFISGKLGEFDKTLFHFLMKRIIGSMGKDFVIDTILERPEETQECLNYLRRIRSLLNQGDINHIASILNHPACLYDYQRYQILKWFYDNEIQNDQVLSYCRRQIQSSSADLLCRSYSYAYIGFFAEAHDYEILQAAYIKTSNWLERATIVCAMYRAPVSIRRHFYGRVKGEDVIVDRAISWAN
jgi:hypothetical protein